MHAYYEKFTDRARKAIDLANDLALSRRHALLTPLHVLWGILEEGDNVARQALINLGIDVAALQTRVAGELGVGDYATHDHGVPYDQGTCACVCSAIDHGRRAHFIACNHLLTGLLSNASPAQAMLEDMNVSGELVLSACRAMLKK